MLTLPLPPVPAVTKQTALMIFAVTKQPYDIWFCSSLNILTGSIGLVETPLSFDYLPHGSLRLPTLHRIENVRSGRSATFAIVSSEIRLRLLLRSLRLASSLVQAFPLPFPRLRLRVLHLGAPYIRSLRHSPIRAPITPRIPQPRAR